MFICIHFLGVHFWAAFHSDMDQKFKLKFYLWPNQFCLFLIWSKTVNYLLMCVAAALRCPFCDWNLYRLRFGACGEHVAFFIHFWHKLNIHIHACDVVCLWTTLLLMWSERIHSNQIYCEIDRHQDNGTVWTYFMKRYFIVCACASRGLTRKIPAFKLQVGLCASGYLHKCKIVVS